MSESEPKPERKRITIDEWGEIQELPWNILDRAIARWRETTARAARARELAELDRRLDKWAEHEGDLEIRSRTDLLRAILTVSPDFEKRYVLRPEKAVWPAIGITMHDHTYLAVPDPYQEGETKSDGPDKMMLVVMDRKAILDATEGLNLNLVSPELS